MNDEMMPEDTTQEAHDIATEMRELRASFDSRFGPPTQGIIGGGGLSPLSLRQRVDRSVASTEADLTRLRRLKALLDNNPDLGEALDLFTQTAHRLNF